MARLSVGRILRLAAFGAVLAALGAVPRVSTETEARAQPAAPSCGLSPCGPQSYRALCGVDPSYAPGEIRYSTCYSDHRSCFVNGRWYCIPPSPEELAEKAARERRAAERKQLIDSEVRRLGEHRRAEVERSVDMRLQAEAARPKLATAPAQPAYPPPPRPKASCASRTFAQTISTTGRSRDTALASVNRLVAGKSGCNIGGSESIVSLVAGAPTCVQRPAPYIKPPPVGTCLACITEQQAASVYGWVRGTGYPPPPTEWVCSVSAQCTAQRCATGPASVSPQ